MPPNACPLRPQMKGKGKDKEGTREKGTWFDPSDEIVDMPLFSNLYYIYVKKTLSSLIPNVL